MRNTLISLFLQALTLMTLSTSTYGSPLDRDRRAGTDIPNGGDELKQQYRWTKEALYPEILNLNKCSFQIGTEPLVKEFILNNKMKIAEDIKDTIHLWPEDTEQAPCALTLSHPKADLVLSLEKCQESTNTRSSIKRLLVHESVHHFIATEQYLDFDTEHFADLVAEAISNSQYMPSCDEAPPRKLVSMGHKICYLNENKINCLNRSERFGITAVDGKDIQNPKDIAGIDDLACVIDDYGLRCDNNNSNWGNLKDVYKPLELMKVDSSTICIRSYDGIPCFAPMYSEVVHHRNNLNEFENLKIAANYQNHLQTMNFDDIKIHYPNNHTVRTRTIKEIKKPIDFNGIQDHSCAIGDKGTWCWDAPNYQTSGAYQVTGLDFPSKVIASLNYGCALDRNQIKCWKKVSGGVTTKATKLNIILDTNDTLISFFGWSDICYTREDQYFNCTRINL